MAHRSGMRWRWSNVPLPEPHVGGLLLGLLLHRRYPSQLDGPRPWHTSVGVGSIGGSLLLIAWTVWTMGETKSARPDHLVTTGPYAYSRNPMYVAWTGVYAGVALVLNSVWVGILLPVVLLATHAAIRREERALEREFHDEYRSYRESTPRYLPVPRFGTARLDGCSLVWRGCSTKVDLDANP